MKRHDFTLICIRLTPLICTQPPTQFITTALFRPTKILYPKKEKKSTGIWIKSYKVNRDEV